jgi:hypothetical protein
MKTISVYLYIPRLSKSWITQYFVSYTTFFRLIPGLFAVCEVFVRPSQEPMGVRDAQKADTCIPTIVLPRSDKIVLKNPAGELNNVRWIH